MKSTKLSVPGISCSHCAETIKKALHLLEGVNAVAVDVLQKTLTCSHDDRLPLSAIVRALRAAGYPPKQKAHHGILSRMHARRLLLSLVLSLPFMILMLSTLFVSFHIPFWVRIFEVLCTAIIVFILGHEVIAATMRSFLRFSFGMESLIGIGSLSACISGILGLFGFPFENFISIASMIMVIHFLGLHIRNKCTKSAGNEVQKLLELGAKTAQKLYSNGSVRELPIESITMGDTLLVSAGSVIPVDGTITRGSTLVDESMITGEFLPTRKSTGDSVIGGSINHDGLIHVRAEKLGKDSFLSRIIALIEQAQMTKVPVQELVDTIAAVFVPIVVGLSIASGLFWILFPNIGATLYAIIAPYIPWVDPLAHSANQAIVSFIATLVIACPCALGLATPTAISVGIGMAAKQGILIKHAAAIQIARDITAIGFDKTGTLTEGKPQLVHIESTEDITSTVHAAAAILSNSTHPLAKAIVEYAKQHCTKAIPLATHTTVPGYGVAADYEGTQWYIGSKAYMESLSLDTKELPKAPKEHKTASKVYIAKNTTVIGVCYLQDTIRSDAARTIAAFHKLGIETHLFSGDNNAAVQHFARKLGIRNAYGGLLPAEKVQRIQALQDAKNRIAMVGDGINDAPALKQADLSIAMGYGTDIAIETAAIVLVNKNLMNCKRTIQISRKTMTTITQNLLWAFFFNILAIPLAMIGLLHPLIAEAAMAVSSILVVLNALRLRLQARKIFDLERSARSKTESSFDFQKDLHSDTAKS